MRVKPEDIDIMFAAIGCVAMIVEEFNFIDDDGKDMSHLISKLYDITRRMAEELDAQG